MRLYKLALLGTMALSGAALSAADTPAAKPAADASVPNITLNLPKTEETFTKDQTIEAFGWFLAQQTGLVALGFTKDEIAALSRGMSAAVNGQPAPYDMNKIGPSIQSLLAARRQTALAKMREEGMAETAKFMAEVKTRPGVVTLDDGLAYQIVKEGDGPAPRPDQFVKVNYVGRLVDGTEFDRSEEGKPVEFGLKSVIPGWSEGLTHVKKGGKAILYIPPQLAYGDQGAPGIRPGSTLVFEVELLDVKDASSGNAATEPDPDAPPVANPGK